MNRVYLVIVCVLAIITTIVYVFVVSYKHKRTLCRQSPYYFCDPTWTCCKTTNCDTTGPTTANSYGITDRYYGGLKLAHDGNDNDYYKCCVQLVDEAAAKYQGGDMKLDCIYDDTQTCTVPPGVVVTDCVGKCAYRKFDYNQNNSIYYPTQQNQNGNWSSGNPYAAQYQVNANNYQYPPTNGVPTLNNSCNNSLYGISNTTKAYSGCPGHPDTP